MIGKVMAFNPFTGTPRHPDDIASDPSGMLVWDGEEPLRAATPPAQPSAQGEAVAHPSHQTVRDWMPVNEALRLADVWSVGDLDNCGQWRAAIKVLADEVRALASAPAAPAAPAQAVPLTTEQIAEIALESVYNGDASVPYRKEWTEDIGIGFVRAIERAHGITPKAAQP